MEKIVKIPQFQEVAREHVNKWVALSDDYKRVIASGDTLASVLKKTPGQKRRVVFRVLPGLGYAPLSLD